MNASSFLRRAARLVSSVLQESSSNQRSAPAGRGDRAPAAQRDRATGPGKAYPGDYEGAVRPRYSPDLDGEPDPGEIVWTWVPFEEDHSRGKDRPVLVVGHDGPWLLALMLSTRDRDTDPGPRREHWLDLGTGDWDPQRRPSEVRLDRVVRVAPDTVRREGAVLDRGRFDRVAAKLGGSGNW